MSFNTTTNIFQDVDNFTKNYLMPKAQDTILKSNVVLQILQDNVTAWKGKQHEVAIKYDTVWGTTAFSWLDLLAKNYKDTTKKMAFNHASYANTIAVSNMDLNMAKTPENVIDLATYKVEEGTQEMADYMGLRLYWYSGTSASPTILSSSKEFIWLAHWASKAALVANYWGLARSSVTTIDSWWYDATSYTTWWTKFSLDKLDEAIRSCESGNYMVDYIITTKDVFHIIEKLLPAQQAFYTPWVQAYMHTWVWWATPLEMNYWYRTLIYKGIKIVHDEKCPANRLFLISKKTWELALFQSMEDSSPIKVNSSIIEWQYDKNLEKPVMFHATPWQNSQDQYGKFMRIMMAWNLYCKNPRFNWMFNDIQW